MRNYSCYLYEYIQVTDFANKIRSDQETIMDKPKWVVATKVAGELQAELMRGLLEAQGIDVHLAIEGAARAIGITAGPLGEVDVMVPEAQLEEAMEVINSYRAGEFEEP
jgi:hypothetical protein